MARTAPRYLSRTAACLALVGGLAASACTDGNADGPAGLDAREGAFRVLPQLTFEGAGLNAATDEGLDAAWRERARWHVMAIANPDGRTAADDTIPVSPQSEADTLEVVITTRPGDASYDLHFTALDGEGGELFTVVMEGVVPPSGDDVGPVPLQGTLQYVGPGADASAVRASVDTLRLPPGSTAVVTAQVVDGQGNAIEGVPLGWTSDDTGIASVEGRGSEVTVTGVAGGVTRVVVSTPTGLQDGTVVIVDPLVIFPEQVERLPGGTQQFTVDNAPDGATLEWSVNGVVGGGEAFGTITQDGFYTAPGEVPNPDHFPVCVQFEGAPSTAACATMVIRPIPTAGEDLVVINDMNIFDNNAMTQGVGDPNNHVMVRNLVGFTGDLARSGQSVILWDRGRSSPCWAGGSGECSDAGMQTTRTVIEEAGFGIRSIESTEGSLTSIDPDVKMIWLWNPTVVFTVEEVNALKQFAAEGGRILLVGEHAGFFGPAGIQTENQLLADMGAEMVNVGNAVECGFNDLPENVLREHQITDGMTAVRLACASVIEPGPNDFVLFTDRSETQVLAGVAKIDVVPISEHAPLPVSDPEAPVVGNSSASGEDVTGGR